MTRDDILRLAREAGGTLSSFDRWSMHTSDVVRFSALVAAAEREACLEAVRNEWMTGSKPTFLRNLEDAILARGDI